MDLPGQEVRHNDLPRMNLFNRISVILLIGWVAIVATAAELAGTSNLSTLVHDKTLKAATLEAFMRTLF